MAQDPGARTAQIKVGYENFRPPPVPPGMYFDRESWLILPEGVRPAGKGRVAASYLLGVGLFIVTLGVGYLAWGMVRWGRGQTPAQRILDLRCWRPEAGRPAGRKHMAIRQVTGLLLNGELLMGPIIWVASTSLNSVGDFFAGTAVVHDPGHVLADWTSPIPPISPIPPAG
jgi:uncharacterized RDD family membrane protein YckC